MRSPFPGMDPYLEEPLRWGGFHGVLIAVLGELLTKQVTPRFFVDSKRDAYRLGILDPARPLVAPPPQSVTVSYANLEVIEVATRKVVTVIKVLSPINKVAGSKGWQGFRQGRRERWQARRAHWLEIDLLRGGERPVEVGNHGDYYALLRRAGAEDIFEVWFIDLRDELPVIAVPLVDSVPDAPLDLQAAVQTVFQRFRYDAVIDYDKAPPPPLLDAHDSAWAAERIRRWRTEN